MVLQPHERGVLCGTLIDQLHWKVMNGLLSHKRKKLKFVYDETIHHKVDMTQCSPELAIIVGPA